MTVALQDNVPTSLYRMGFAAAPLDPQSSIVWTDITTFTAADGIERLRVLSRHSDAGKKDAQSNVDASRGTYLVDNRDGAFTPENTGSPYYPNVKLNVIFQELQTWFGTTYPVYTGYTDDFDIRADEVGNPQVLISCVDAQKMLGLDSLEDSVWRIEVRKDVSANIAAGRNTAWLRLNDASNSQVATDYSGMGFDGTYQNEPILGAPSIIAGDIDTCMDVAHTADQRASLPYKHLITGFPFTIEMVARVFPKRDEFKFLVAAYNVPSLQAPQALQIFIGSNTFGGDAGKIIALLTNPYPTGTQSLSSITVDDGVEHHIVIVMAAANSLRIWIDGADFTAPGHTDTFPYPSDLVTGYGIANAPALANADFGLNAGFSVDAEGNEITGGIQSVVFYDGLELSSTRIQKHAQAAIVGWGSVSSGSRVDQLLDTLGWPAADRAVDGGSTSVSNLVSGDTPLAYLQLLADTEGGRFFISPEGWPSFHGRNRALVMSRSTTPQVIFDDAGTPGMIPYIPPFEPHLDDIDLWYRASVTRQGGAPQIYDATPGSTSTRTLTKTGLLMDSDADARAMSQYLVSVSKKNLTRVRTLTFQPQASPTFGWMAALGLRQGDRITVNRTFEGCPTWTADWIVEGITHDWLDAESFWTTQLLLSPADPNHYFLLGSSVLGGSDLLFY